MAIDNQIPACQGNCVRCGSSFPRFEREYICIACRRKSSHEPQPPTRELSNRERQIVNLIGQAKTNKMIAFELGLTEGTIKEYMHHIFRKVGCTNRTELAIQTLRRDQG